MTPDYSTECLTPQQRNPSMPTVARVPHIEARPMTPLQSHLTSAASVLRFVVGEVESGTFGNVKIERDLLLKTCRDVAESLDGRSA